LSIANFALFFLASAENCDITVESNAPNIVHKTDIRLTGYLHGARLASKLQNDGPDLGSTRCTDGMAF
jgi:hypothetical protein